MKEKKNRYVCAAVLVTLLVLQLAALIYTGARKQDLHIDEYYSYILSNSYETDRISHATQVWNTWLSGEDFRDFLSVEPGEGFAYDRVYYNNSLDAHPPLFYFLLHTVCSLAPGSSSMWLGLGMNIVLTLGTQLCLFFLARSLLKSDLWALLPVAIYGGMGAFFDNTLFIRMYPLLTLFTVLTVWLHYRLTEKPESRARAAWCFAVTFLGIFTQYYFAVLSFLIAAAYCLWRLCKRDWKGLAFYAVGMVLAVALVFVLYPAGISQITGSETNNVGKEVMGNLLDFSGWPGAARSMARQILRVSFSGLKPLAALWLCLSAVALTLSFLLRKKEVRQPLPGLGIMLCLGGLAAGTAVLIAHISGSFVYVRYVYNLFPLFALAAALVLRWIAGKLRLRGWVLVGAALVILCGGTLTFAANDTCEYLFRDRGQNHARLLEACEGRPVIVLNNGTTYHPTGNLGLILQLEQVYMADHSEMADINAILPEAENGAVFIVLTDRYWSQGLDGDAAMRQIVADSLALTEYEKLGTCSFSTVYLAQ